MTNKRLIYYPKINNIYKIILTKNLINQFSKKNIFVK